MARFDIKLLGDRELVRELEQLTEKLERKVLISAFRKAAKAVLLRAQQNVGEPVVTFAPGTSARKQKRLRRLALRFASLRNHMTIRPLRRRKHRVGYGVATATRAQMGITDRYYYPAHLEAGHGPPHRDRAVDRFRTGRLLRREIGTGRTPPHPFLRPALKGQESQIRTQLANDIRAGIERELRK